MADETVTAADVRMYPGCATRQLPFSETMTAGEVAAISSQELAKAQAADSVAVTDFDGVVVLEGTGDHEGLVVTAGDIDPGFTVDPGAAYYVSKNAGGITKAVGDLTNAGLTIIGHGVAANKLRIKKVQLGVVGA